MSEYQPEIVILTDIHIRSCSEKKYQELLQIISELDSNKTKTLIILGDIFDFFLGNSSYFQKKYSEFILALESLARTTCKVYYLHGNHEFLLNSVPWKYVQIIGANDFVLELENKTFAFCHGDFLFPSKKYKIALSFLRSKLLLTSLKLLPGFLLDKMCLAYARYSHSKAKPNDEKKMSEAAKKWLTELKADEGFVGHFHQSLEVTWEGKKVNFLSPGSHLKNHRGDTSCVR